MLIVVIIRNHVKTFVKMFVKMFLMMIVAEGSATILCIVHLRGRL